MVTEPCQFSMVVVLVNEKSPKGKKKRWAVIKDAHHLAVLFLALFEAATNLPSGAKGPEIIRSASASGFSREQLEVAWVVVDTIIAQGTTISQVQKVEAWWVVNSPGKLVICMAVNKTRARGRRRRARKRVGPIVR